MTRLITSQDYLNDAIVADKLAARDFAVFVSPEFDIDGETFRVVLDGHHSLAAALSAGEEYEINEQDATDNDNVAILLNGDVDGFLMAVHHGADYRDAITGRSCF